jgi:hypothetical protein
MRDGFLIQELSCPRCTIRRTMGLANGNSFCFNCRFQWPTQPVAGDHAARAMIAPPQPSEPFGVAEQARLAIYRAAVRAGFYSDWPARCGNARLTHDSQQATTGGAAALSQLGLL